MGQSMKKLAWIGDDEQKKKEIIKGIIDTRYENIKAKKDIKMSEFYHEICDAVEDMNSKLQSGFQFKSPSTEALQRAFDKHHTSSSSLTKPEFEKIVTDVAFEMGGKGMRDILLYLYGIPISATLVKQVVFPEMVSDDIFIPLVTSASVFILAKMKRL